MATPRRQKGVQLPEKEPKRLENAGAILSPSKSPPFSGRLKGNHRPVSDSDKPRNGQYQEWSSQLPKPKNSAADLGILGLSLAFVCPNPSGSRRNRPSSTWRPHPVDHQHAHAHVAAPQNDQAAQPRGQGTLCWTSFVCVCVCVLEGTPFLLALKGNQEEKRESVF